MDGKLMIGGKEVGTVYMDLDYGTEDKEVNGVFTKDKTGSFNIDITKKNPIYSLVKWANKRKYINKIPKKDFKRSKRIHRK